MIPKQWEQIKDLFEAALELSSEAREKFVSQLSEDNPTLAKQVANLLSSSKKAGDFLNTPWTLMPELFQESVGEMLRFSPHEFICQRFRIIRFIGKGGMGEVYEAWDEELQDSVAVKTLRLEFSAHEVFASRFRREIQIARKVTHPNVCRIFDSFRHTSEDGYIISILSMELLRGETLAEYLKSHGRLPTSRALPLATQIIEGLNAIHKAGIIHRDLKPSNLILVPNDGGFLVKITDFGVAGHIIQDDSHSTLTKASRPLGTPEYMAPEQMEYGHTSIRTDIYSLGLILFEMVTGTTPFSSTGMKRIYEDPCPPKKLVPDLPEYWDKVIRCCLERESTYRFSNISDVSEAFQNRAFKAPPTSLRRRLRRIRNPYIIFIFIFLFLALSGYYLRIHQWKPKISEGSTIFLPEIVNTTSDQQLEAITDLMRNELAQSSKFMLLDRSSVNEVLRQMGRSEGSMIDTQGIRELAWRTGTSLILFSTLSRNGNRYVFDLRVEKVSNRPTGQIQYWDRSFSAARKEDLFDIVSQACQWFRRLVENIPDNKFARDLPPQSTTTSSWQALLLFSQAERLKAAGQTLKAITLLEQSTALDPDFSLAYMRLGDLYNSLRDEKEGFSNWMLALRAMQRRPVTQKEELRIKALFAQDSGDLNGSEENFRTLEILYPHEYLPSFYLATTLIRLNRLGEAKIKISEAEAKQPDSYYPVAQEARLDLMLGQLTSAENAVLKLRMMGHPNAADSVEVGLDMLREDFIAAFHALDRLQQSPDALYKSKSYSLRAALLGELGNNADAIKVLSEGVNFDSTKNLAFNEADKWLALAYLHLKIGDRYFCRTACSRALHKENGRVHLLQAGILLAQAGFLTDAGTILKSLQSWPSLPAFEQAKHQLRGMILARQGRQPEAIRELRVAAQLDSSNTLQDYLADALQQSGKSREAFMLYKQIVKSPAAIWQAPDLYFPGLWTTTVDKYLTNPMIKDDDLKTAVKARYLHLKKFSQVSYSAMNSHP